MKNAAARQKYCGNHRIGVDVSAQYEDDLMEYNNGLLAGLAYEKAAAKYPIPPENKKAYISFTVRKH
ncbi:MAG: hypothetical protein WBJ55_09055 [Limnochordia bacterium]